MRRESPCRVLHDTTSCVFTHTFFTQQPHYTMRGISAGPILPVVGKEDALTLPVSSPSF